MEEFYPWLVGAFFLLAILDLIVGVSNDAVNFLNSSFGSKVATRRVILIIASLGILVGAAFSSGMMEVARKGVFQPEMFSFSEVMIVFFAVMITDVILLDFFNTYALPTSTTVSIVFELLGAATLLSLFKILNEELPLAELSNFINTVSAITIIGGIFLSITIAFVLGAVLQYFARIIFSFSYEKKMRWFGGLWAGFCFSALSYFIVIKGIKGASFYTTDIQFFIEDKMWGILALSFIATSLFAQTLIMVFKVDVFKPIVLLGTFALALSFASNDLVNFIGVPLAGLSSFQAWNGSGVAPELFNMKSLLAPVRSNNGFLLISGAVMVATLWLSKKARNVTETEINLGRQTEGEERFSPNDIARFIVKIARRLEQVWIILMPSSLKQKLNKSFESPENKPKAAFDLVRASVNLTMASILISFATSLKLPLSTTYVSFMVAMGTSLSDRAWGRESATYRVAGVLNVVAGWFVTAFAAFSLAGIVAVSCGLLGGWGYLVFIALAAFSLYRNRVIHKKREHQESIKKEVMIGILDNKGLVEMVFEKSRQSVYRSMAMIKNVVLSLKNEDEELIRELREEIDELSIENSSYRAGLYQSLRIGRLHEEYILMSIKELHMRLDLQNSLEQIIEIVRLHILNQHKALTSNEMEKLLNLQKQVGRFLYLSMSNEQVDQDIHDLSAYKQQIFDQIENEIPEHTSDMELDSYSYKTTYLYFSLLLAFRDIIAIAHRYHKLASPHQEQISFEKTKEKVLAGVKHSSAERN